MMAMFVERYFSLFQTEKIRWIIDLFTPKPKLFTGEGNLELRLLEFFFRVKV